ncbi:Membrane-bound lytic murein transglycosylase B precursor [Methyloligella halotolerans]|uniref:Membrane-bound lytic murein transglycosylase B n=1 Tax=Methyloligella halotolerans TaxID=1177755 RepID=A0A1E2RWV1_9HYPH|nr:lytic murein transglycosylase [Methyloligella halotolerans]ODA66610.1 Membrane-bound lytic murein transglycosylase B precursor [Methyloligella halotolerans]
MRGWIGSAGALAKCGLAVGALALGLAGFGSVAEAAQCGTSAAGFDTWKRQFAAEAQQRGIGSRGIQALMGTQYAYGTIKADRGQHSFKLSLDQFMAKRGAATIAAQGRSKKAQNAQLFAAIEQRYGVPAGPLIAIWGMETAFGNYMGNQNTLSAVATLAYDCRRPEFFQPHLMAALQLVDRGSLTASQRGAMHGEVGHTQFLPANIIRYGVDGNGDGRVDLNDRADALASTANFLRGHGWRPGAGYQPGQPNYAAIQGWNAASVYQQTIAIVGRQIDGG